MVGTQRLDCVTPRDAIVLLLIILLAIAALKLTEFERACTRAAGGAIGSMSTTTRSIVHKDPLAWHFKAISLLAVVVLAVDACAARQCVTHTRCYPQLPQVRPSITESASA